MKKVRDRKFIECTKDIKFGNLRVHINDKFVDNKLKINTEYGDPNIPIDILEKILRLHTKFMHSNPLIEKDSNYILITPENEELILMSIFGETD